VQPVTALVPMTDAPLLVPDAKGTGFTTVELDRGRLRRWDFAAANHAGADRGELPDWPTPYQGGDVVVSADGRRLARGTSLGRVSQWDLGTRQRFGKEGDLGQPVQRMAYSPDGSWLAITGEEGTVELFDSLTGSRVGPTLTHRSPLRGLAFSPDGRELVTVSQDGRSVRWGLGKALPLGPAEWRALLEATTGLRPADPLDLSSAPVRAGPSDQLVPLTVAEHNQRQERTRQLQTHLAGPARPEGWHAEQALDALQAGQLASARYHLDRWIERRPDAWLPLAWRATVHTLEGSAQEAEADFDRAAKLKGGEEVASWKAHQAIATKLLRQRN
jgi:WD domain, G-beta repeat